MKKIKIIIFFLILGLFFYYGKIFYSSCLSDLARYQHQQLIKITNGFKSNNGKEKLITIGILFFYGIIHSLGPGHGKSIISSASLLENRYRKILILGAIIAFLQGTIGYILVKVFSLLSQTLSIMQVENAGDKIKLLTSILVLFIGISLLSKQFFKKNKLGVKNNKDKNIYLLAFLTGLVPCYGIVNVLLFLNLLHLEQYSLISALAISSGMYLVISIFGIFSLKFSKNIIKLDENLLKIMNCIGPALIILYSGNYIFYRLILIIQRHQ